MELGQDDLEVSEPVIDDPEHADPDQEDIGVEDLDTELIGDEDLTEEDAEDLEGLLADVDPDAADEPVIDEEDN